MPTGRILVVEDRPESVAWFSDALTPANEVAAVDTFEEALVRVRGGDYDLIVVSLGMRGFDGLRLCSQLRSLPEGRNVPILVVVSEGERRKLTQALEMGVNDYLTRPVDKNELIARVRTQLRKKRYADRLRHNVQLSLEMAITDQLTGLHNRRYMARHLSIPDFERCQDGQAAGVPDHRHRLLQVGQRHPWPRHRRRGAARIRRPHRAPMCAASIWPAATAARNSWS